jgi:hypothetical protein
MTDRSDEVERVQVPLCGGGVAERVAVVAKLRPGSREQARQILAKGAPYDLGVAGFRRHSVFLAEEAAVFVFEGSGIEWLVRDLVDDPARSAAFSVWGRSFKGRPRSRGRSSTGKPASPASRAERGHGRNRMTNWRAEVLAQATSSLWAAAVVALQRGSTAFLLQRRFACL